MKTPHGTARRLRRRDMAAFRAQQRARSQKATGTFTVNAPTMHLLGQYVVKVQA